MTSNKSILIFGTGELQESIINRCKLKGLYTIGIDPNPDAVCKELVDVFEVVGGNDLDRTLEVAKKYNVSGVITAATDKPLVMMAQVAHKLNLPFYSEKTARASTDKYLMKERFIAAGINCAEGLTISSKEELIQAHFSFPVIVKPRDNSGSRGVIYCADEASAIDAVNEALQFTNKGNVLIEEFIEGKEYSVEGLHYNGEHHVIQITEKTTTDFPYNVELGHTQPADLSKEQWSEIVELIKNVANALGFENCASHTEIKINSTGIFVIETSPRLGGDYISSTLVPLSTGISMEDILIDIAVANDITSKSFEAKYNMASAIKYLQLPEGRVVSISNMDELNDIDGVINWQCNLKAGDVVGKITNSLNRYGQVILQVKDKQNLTASLILLDNLLKSNIVIN